MVELDGNHKFLFSDNYFPLIPIKKSERIISVKLLECLSDEPIQLNVGILGFKELQIVDLK
jgi:hypothetical protein